MNTLKFENIAIEDRFTGEFSEEIVSVPKPEDINSKAGPPPKKKYRHDLICFWNDWDRVTDGTRVNMVDMHCIFGKYSDQVSDTVFFDWDLYM